MAASLEQDPLILAETHLRGREPFPFNSMTLEELSEVYGGEIVNGNCLKFGRSKITAMEDGSMDFQLGIPYSLADDFPSLSMKGAWGAKDSLGGYIIFPPIDTDIMTNDITYTSIIGKKCSIDVCRCVKGNEYASRVPSVVVKAIEQMRSAGNGSGK
jgi:hypothetical protein